MTPAQKDFLTVLGASLHGGHLSPEPLAQTLPEILADAVRQHLLPLLAETVPEAFGGGTGDLSPYRQLAIHQATLQAQRSLDFRALYRDLRRAGLRPIVVKGELCSRLYPYPYHRISVDNDLFLPVEEFPACHRVLLAHGLHAEVPEDRLSSEDEITYRDSEGRFYIELHRALFDTSPQAPDNINSFFSDVFENAVEMDGFLSMPPQSHLLYLLLHAYKHFIYSGVGIRQTCDIGLWAQYYAPEIDWAWLLDSCRSIHGERFAAAQFRIAEEFLGLSLPLPALWRSIDTDPEPMLADLFSGGVFGAESLTRLHTATATLNAIRRSRNGSGPGTLASVFPSLAYMERQYPYLRTRPVLLPAAWLSRIFHYLREVRQEDSSSASGSLRLAKERIALLKQYGILS